MTPLDLLRFFARHGYNIRPGGPGTLRVRCMIGPTHPDALALATYAKPMLLAYLTEHPPVPWFIDASGRQVFADGRVYAPNTTGGWRLVECPHCPEACR